MKILKKIINFFNPTPKIQISDTPHTREMLSWMLSNEPTVHFNLTLQEKTYFKDNFLNSWKENDYDDSFLDWDSKTPYFNLNYLIECFQEKHGFIKSQDAFDYICEMHPPILSFFKEKQWV